MKADDREGEGESGDGDGGSGRTARRREHEGEAKMCIMPVPRRHAKTLARNATNAQRPAKLLSGNGGGGRGPS
jgi:hypothetical protein